MFVLVKEKRFFTRGNLTPEKEFRYKGFTIYNRNGSYYICLNDGYSFSDQTKLKRLICDRYIINMPDTYDVIKVYVYEDDKGINDYAFYENRNFIIADSPKADIICKDVFLKKNYLILKDGILSSNYDLAVNGLQYDGFKLEQGDIVEYLGFRFIYYDDFLYINHFNCEIHLNPYNIKPQQIRYPLKTVRFPTYIASERKEFVLPELEEYEAVNLSTHQEIVRTITPNIVMSLSILAVSLISFSSSIYNGRGTLNSLTYIISPLAMIISGVLLPLIFYKAEKKRNRKEFDLNKKNYLNYLEEYDKQLDELINAYFSYCSESYFSILKMKEEPFYLKSNDPDFLTLSLGLTFFQKEFIYKKCDKDIDAVLDKISRKLSHIDNYPLLLDLKENRIVTVITKPSDRFYFFERFLLELSYKHSFEDIMIGVYGKDIRVIDSFYNLPHLFENHRRMTFNDAKQLQDLDQQKLEKPLVLMMLDRSDFVFSNPQIIVIYFSLNRDDLYRNSECVVEYLNNKATLRKERVLSFSYVKELTDFSKYFSRLGKYNNCFDLHETMTFSKLYKDFDIKESYQSSHHYLKADFAYSGDDLLSFDLHETHQGPHGLIGGSTGSGKSELIISFLLSLCIRYSPEYLNIVLIDYKGGGIEESLSYQGKSVPHIIASISNLENDSFERLIIALNNECLRRQKLFKKLSSLTGISIMNLDDYLNNNYEKYGLNRIAHLLITVDEFAELKKENPEQIKELISISRIGRSLGVHLILATQKPAGNIDDEIWSNSRFKISLKVFEEKDSQDLIRSKDGAYLKDPGSFLLRVDESIIRAQSIYAKNDISGNDPYEVKVLDNKLDMVSQKRIQNGKSISEASDFVRRINEASEELKLHIDRLDFLPPTPLKRSDYKDNGLILGEIDDYLNGIRRPLVYDIKDNILISSTRPKEINGILNILNQSKLQTIVISQNHYEASYISDVISYDEEEDIRFLIEFLLKNNPEVTLLIEDLNILLSYGDDYPDLLSKLVKRSENMNFNIIALSSSPQLSFKLINSFRKRVMIQIEEPSDLNFFFNMRSRYKGKSFCFIEEPLCFVPLICEELISEERVIQPLIRKIPETVKADEKEEGILIGFDMNNRKEVYVKDNIMITSFSEELLEPYKVYGDKVTAIPYENTLASKANDSFLWIGPGVFSQRLFVSSCKDDLLNNEGIYVSKGKKYLLRCLDA
ncbi:MAG: hypothetical protein IK151_07200 [Erysipelotrichaceae bacterium]|nr:hypothetical protein [Erysipelotrichaceae bacterium]